VLPSEKDPPWSFPARRSTIAAGGHAPAGTLALPILNMATYETTTTSDKPSQRTYGWRISPGSSRCQTLGLMIHRDRARHIRGRLAWRKNHARPNNKSESCTYDGTKWKQNVHVCVRSSQLGFGSKSGKVWISITCFFHIIILKNIPQHMQRTNIDAS
jgi:hypothetical protein